MRITERRLRRIIREVIKENVELGDPHAKTSEEDHLQKKLEEEIAETIKQCTIDSFETFNECVRQIEGIIGHYDQFMHINEDKIKSDMFNFAFTGNEEKIASYIFVDSDKLPTEVPSAQIHNNFRGNIGEKPYPGWEQD